MAKFAYEIKAWLIFVQLEDVALKWTDAELRTALEEDLKRWAGEVDGEVGSLYIMINRV